jgi:hypothetical protein
MRVRICQKKATYAMPAPSSNDPHKDALLGLNAAEKAIAKAKTMAASGQYRAAAQLVRDTVDVLSDLDNSLNEADQFSNDNY